MKEEWRTINEYPDYIISNWGRVKSIKFGKERILKQGKNRYGYFYVGLCKDRKRKYYFVHRIVATHFLPNPENKPQIDHIDTNPQNNCISNLRWVTNKENMNNPITLKKIKKHQKSILQFSKKGRIILHKWESIRQAIKELNINKGNVIQCLKGNRKTAGGFKWMYYEDYVNRMNYYFELALKNVS